MSGGSYDYAYGKIDDLADHLQVNSNPKRLAFKELLRAVALAAHDIEWVDSNDYCPGGEDAAIDAVFSLLKIKPDDFYKIKTYDEIKRLIIRNEPKLAGR